VPILYHNIRTKVAYAFLSKMFNKFGTTIEAFINQGLKNPRAILKIM
jgi:hypothetical protein